MMSLFNKEQVQEAVSLGRFLYESRYCKYLEPAAKACHLTSQDQAFMALALAYHHNYVLDAENGKLVIMTAPKYIGEMKPKPVVFRGPDGTYPDERPRTVTIFYEAEPP